MIILVQRFACIFFQMRAGQVHGFHFRFTVFFHNKRQTAALNHWNFKLTDLRALGQIGVKIIFAGKYRSRRNRRADRQTELNRALNCTAV